MNKREQLEQELKNARYMLDAVSEEWAKGQEDENGDTVIPSDGASRISILIGDV